MEGEKKMRRENAPVARGATFLRLRIQDKRTKIGSHIKAKYLKLQQTSVSVAMF